MNPIIDIFCYDQDTQYVAEMDKFFTKIQMPAIHHMSRNELLYKLKMYSKDIIGFSYHKKCQVDITDFPDIVMTGVGNEEQAGPYIDFVLKVLNKENVKTHEKFYEFYAPTLTTPRAEKEYSFESNQLINGWMIYEIRRPREDPFTIVLRDYPDHGMEPMFAWLYHCKAWGIMYDDFPFLQAIWNNYKEQEKLQGDLTHERLPIIQQKYKHLYLEPEIYRRALKHVVRQLQEEAPPMEKRIKLENKSLL